MSHRRTKITYEETGSYGSTDIKTIYCHENLSCDITTFYDDSGEYMFSFEDTEHPNKFDAIIALMKGDPKTNKDVIPGHPIEFMTPEDCKKCGI